jgi:hypothetical protein
VLDGVVEGIGFDSEFGFVVEEGVDTKWLRGELYESYG